MGAEGWCPFDRHIILTPDMREMWDTIETEVRQEKEEQLNRQDVTTKTGPPNECYSGNACPCKVDTVVIHIEPPLIGLVYRSVERMGRRGEGEEVLTPSNTSVINQGHPSAYIQQFQEL